MKLGVFAAVSSLVLAVGAVASADDDFYQMCHATSLADGLDDASASGFCTCLTDAASGDSALYDELYQAGTSEPDLQTRLAMLSDDARSTAESCQG